LFQYRGFLKLAENSSAYPFRVKNPPSSLIANYIRFAPDTGREPLMVVKRELAVNRHSKVARFQPDYFRHVRDYHSVGL